MRAREASALAREALAAVHQGKEVITTVTITTAEEEKTRAEITHSVGGSNNNRNSRHGARTKVISKEEEEVLAGLLAVADSITTSIITTIMLIVRVIGIDSREVDSTTAATTTGSSRTVAGDNKRSKIQIKEVLVQVQAEEITIMANRTLRTVRSSSSKVVVAGAATSKCKTNRIKINLGVLPVAAAFSNKIVIINGVVELAVIRSKESKVDGVAVLEAVHKLETIAVNQCAAFSSREIVETATNANFHIKEEINNSSHSSNSSKEEACGVNKRRIKIKIKIKTLVWV